MFDREAWGKEYRKKHRKEISAKRKLEYLKNKEKYLKYNKKYYEENKETIKYRRDKIETKKHRSKYEDNKRKTNPKFKLNQTISRLISHSLKGSKAGRHWEKLVGYSLSDLIKSLKQTIPNGYEWKDYIDGKLHLDHIIPISAYEFNKPEDFQFHECWSLNNLRLLPAKENLIKNAKIIKSYQLALKI